MTSLKNTNANEKQIATADKAWQELLGEALQRGFYGAAQVEITVQDGTIQSIRRRIEKIEK